MKNLIPIVCLSLLAGCSGHKEAEQPKKIVKCDSIKESSFDAQGNEIITTKLRCDTIIEQPETKKE